MFSPGSKFKSESLSASDHSRRSHTRLLITRERGETISVQEDMKQCLNEKGLFLLLFTAGFGICSEEPATRTSSRLGSPSCPMRKANHLKQSPEMGLCGMARACGLGQQEKHSEE